MFARQPGLTRRHLLAVSATAAVAAPFGVSGSAFAKSASPGRGRLVDASLAGPVDRAFRYLDTVMDAYQQGDTPRLLQSYNNESGLMTAAFVYDSALAINAYLARPTPDHLRRARIIGDALLWAQNNDERFTDGRVRQAYAAGPMLFYGGWPEFPGLVRTDGKAAFLYPFGFGGSSTGDVCWVGMTLIQLYRATGDRRYLDGAVATGHWVADKVSPYKYGGFHGGMQADGVTPQRWTSTEHNIDAYALFRMLAKVTKDRAWLKQVEIAEDFVEQMWNDEDGYFRTGTIGGLPGEDPNEINNRIVPLDPQTWGYLAFDDRCVAPALDWAMENLANTDGGPESELPAGLTISGVIFGDATKKLTGTVPDSTRLNDRNAVWLEGNGQMAAALLERNRPGDRRRAVFYLLQTVVAQERLGAGQTVGLTSDPNGGRLSNPGDGGTWTGTPLPANSGIVAATSAFDTSFLYGYFQRQHVGATSWFLIGALGANPYQL